MNQLARLWKLPPDLIGSAMNGLAEPCDVFRTCRFLLFGHQAVLFGDRSHPKATRIRTVVVMIFTRFRLLAVLFHCILLGAIVLS
jgi:hypothetical protein